VQLDDTCFTDCTRTRCPLLDDELPVLLVPLVPDDVPEVPELVPPDELLLAIVPVISTFSPTCLLSSLSCPSRM
jgi:hypothetical protein